MKRAFVGWVVRESSEDYEQCLRLVEGDERPDGGLLEWRDGPRHRATVFLSRQAARAAIERTEHYRLAFGSNHPEKRRCSLVPIEVEVAD